MLTLRAQLKQALADLAMQLSEDLAHRASLQLLEYRAIQIHEGCHSMRYCSSLILRVQRKQALPHGARELFDVLAPTSQLHTGRV